MSTIPETLALPDPVEIISELNLARADPPGFAKKISQEYSQFNGKISEVSDQGISSVFQRETHEGLSSVTDAIKFLEQTKPLPPLVHSLSLSRASQDLCADQASSGKIGGATSKGLDLAKRASEHGIWKGKLGENLVYGARNSFDVVAQCIIDDGNSARSNRSKIFDPKYTVVGIYCAPHRQYGNVTSIVFSQDYTSASTVVSDNARIIALRFTEEGESYVAESSATALVDCAHSEIERVYKKGSHFVVVRYKESGFEQKYRLPFSVPAQAIAVQKISSDTLKFSVSKDGLKSAGEWGSDKEVSVASECKIRPDPKSANNTRPVVKLGPNAHDYMKISVEPPKTGATVSVKVKREDVLLTSVIFVFNFDDPVDAESESGTKRVVTSTQTIKIPFIVSPENFVMGESSPSLFVTVIELSKTKYDPDAKEEDITLK